MERERVQWVDALRAFAALGVAWFHLYTDHSPLVELPAVFDLVAVWGRWGVELFFAISGFVLALTLIPRKDIRGPRDIWLYFVRRSVRLDPALWFVVFLYLAAQPLLYPRPYAPGFEWNTLAGSLLYFLPLQQGNYVPVAWSLAIEVQFYLLFATLIALLNRLPIDREKGALLIVGGMALVGAPQYLGWVDFWVGFWIYPHLVTFAVGSAAALVFMRIRGAWWLFGGVAIIAAAGAYNIQGRALATLISAGLFAVILTAPILQKALTWRPLLFLGTLSYGIYLLHPLFGALVLDWSARVLTAPSRWQVFVVIAGIGVTTAAAWALYILVERPSIRASKMIGSHRLDPRPLPC